MTDKATYTPAEFAALFGKERTWGYRQLYAGKVKAITKLGQTLIPQSEVDKLLNGAERYLGAPSHVKRVPSARRRKKRLHLKARRNGLLRSSSEGNTARRRQRMLVPKMSINLHCQNPSVPMTQPARDSRYINA
jgi:hypothetical protein